MDMKVAVLVVLAWWAGPGSSILRGADAPLPRVVVTTDDTVLTRSCEIVIPPGTILADANTNGVLHIGADDIVVRFARDSVLQGAAPRPDRWDGLRGIGIRVNGHAGVTVAGARVHGYFNGLVATRAPRLVIEGGDFSDNYRQRLASTPQAEDGSDWLFPHNNDEVKWRHQYGGAVCVEESDGLILRGVRVRRGQNGILLDRVNGARVYDNDCSFLSGWGLALWRSSSNVIARNAFDFCVRGHVEGVYNRGQDSAGILCFEQCNDNVIAENSATHGGDGFFGFAGREALGEHWMARERDRLRRETGRTEVDDLLRVPPEVAIRFSALGCNRNLLLANDFSYAPAHGIEMTFSEGNIFARNRLVENAICGVWGGYSSATLIAENEFTGNGGMAYGLERGAINMEHAADNRILRNTFRNNKCAVHLWWDNDASLLRSPGVAGNARGVSGNVIADNDLILAPDHPFAAPRGSEKLIGLHLRDDGTNHVRDNLYRPGRTELTASNAVERVVKAGAEPSATGEVPAYRIPTPDLPGRNRPVGARPHLRGRGNILMDEWGPWDHESPLVRPAAGASGERVYEVFGTTVRPAVEITRGPVTASVEPLTNAWRVRLRGPDGASAYAARLTAPGLDRTLSGTLVVTSWDCRFFPWQPPLDPREDLAGWRKLADGPDAVRVTMSTLDFPYGWGGPKDQKLGAEAQRRAPGGDRFGMRATTRLTLPRGRWRFRTLSDDGIRVAVGSTQVIENWNWHGPTTDQGVYEQTADGQVEIEVEHFEIDGYAVLRLEIEPDR